MTPEQTAAAPALPLHPQDELECRRCGVHCDKVVYPGRLSRARLSRSSTPTRRGATRTSAACRRSTTSRSTSTCCGPRRRRKPGFGAILARRRPLPMCKAEIERTYESRLDEELGCINPEFDELPGRRADVPGLRAAQDRLSSASSRRRRIVRAAIHASQTTSDERRAERERVDRADPEPAEGDAEAVQRAVVAASPALTARGAEMQPDRRVAGRADRGRLRALQAARSGERGRRSASAVTVTAARRADAASRRCSRAIVRSVAFRPACRSWTSTCLAGDRPERRETGDRLLDVRARDLQHQVGAARCARRDCACTEPA